VNVQVVREKQKEFTGNYRIVRLKMQTTGKFLWDCYRM